MSAASSWLGVSSTGIQPCDSLAKDDRPATSSFASPSSPESRVHHTAPNTKTARTLSTAGTSRSQETLGPSTRNGVVR